MKKDCKVCVFCKTGQDNIMHYIKKCVEVKEWFKDQEIDSKEKYTKIYRMTS